MKRRATAIAALISVVGLVGSAHADGLAPPAPGRDHDPSARAQRHVDLAGLFGVRIFSDASALGTPTVTSLSTSVLFGVRAARSMRHWLAVEAELPIAVAGTRDEQATAFFFDARVHASFEVAQPGPIQPFGVVGLGLPVVLSSNRPHFASDVQPEGYLGIGARFERATGWNVRVDARFSLLLGRDDHAVAPEFELLLSLYRQRSRAPAAEEPEAELEEEPADLDGDGIPDVDDRCPRREEDFDNFEDDDGCPDIDDDRDEVLDIADKCRLDPETWNGFQDDDGCPDVVPDEVTAISGTLEGVSFETDGPALTRKSYKVLDQVAAVLVQYPSVRGRIVVTSESPGSGPALDLAQARADAVKYYLVARGVSELRLGAVGVDAGGGETEGMVLRRWPAEFQIRRRDTR